MLNFELAQIFDEIADILEMKEVAFKPQAYQKAARNLEMLDKDVKEIYQTGGLRALEEISGIGKGLALKIEEFIKTGRIKEHLWLKKECPVDLDSLKAIEGLGPAKIKILYKKLRIKGLKDLEKAAKAGKIRGLVGFGEKSEQNILQGIEFVRAGHGRFLLGLILPTVRQIIGRLEKLPEVGRISPAGSARRMKETIGDIDILVTSLKPEKVMDFFTEMPEVIKIWAKGQTKSSVRLSGGIDCDLRVIKPESFGAAQQYFTGNKEHNITLRRLAMKKGLKLNEYGLFRGKKQIAGKTEKGVYQGLGLVWLPPELRTNSGEIEAALKPNGLPYLINYDELEGECHCHTDWSDGANTIEEMAKTAKKFGYQYIVVADHAGGLVGITNPLDEKRLLKQMAEIDRVNKKISGIKILKGAEVDIRDNGQPAIEDDILFKLDIVLAAVHSRFKMGREEMTQRIIRAMENPQVDIIAHPTGRIILKREPYLLDFEKIFKRAKQTKTILEINAFYNRLDLRDADVRQAIGAGVRLSIGTDAHSVQGLGFVELGIAMARRGWAEKKDIINAWPLKKMLGLLKHEYRI